MTKTVEMAPEVGARTLKCMKETSDLVIGDTKNPDVMRAMIALALDVSLAVGMMTGFAEVLRRMEKDRVVE